jgi:hypothetical protein
MRIVQTTRVADTVATRLRVRLQGVEGPEGAFYPFHSGRERGWVAWFGTGFAASTGWCFAEARSSDRIVVYECPDWSRANLMGSYPQEMWDSARYFRTPQQAANWMASRIRREVRTHLREYAAHRERELEQRLAEAIDATS